MEQNDISENDYQRDFFFALKWFLKGFEVSELTKNQNCSHEQTMKDAESFFYLTYPNCEKTEISCPHLHQKWYGTPPNVSRKCENCGETLYTSKKKQ